MLWCRIHLVLAAGSVVGSSEGSNCGGSLAGGGGG